MPKPSRSLLSALLAALSLPACAAAEAPCQGATGEEAHLCWAQDLAQNIAPERNEYGSDPTELRWAGVDGASEYSNRSRCASFVTHVIEQARGWTGEDMKAWFGVESPKAAAYHDMIELDGMFEPVRTVEAIEAGDVLAIAYHDENETSGEKEDHVALDVSGHVSIVRTRPVLREPSAPERKGTSQYSVEVLDSSRDPHGNIDSRHKRDGSADSGLGVGSIRLYVDEQGVIVGHTWSFDATDEGDYHKQKTRHVVVGRLR